MCVTGRVPATEDEIVEWFEERAAIIEFCGNRDRKNAEKLAAIRVRKQFGYLPDCVLERLDKEAD